MTELEQVPRRRFQRLRDDVMFLDTTAEASFAPILMSIGFGALTAVALYRGKIRSLIIGSGFSSAFYFAAKCLKDPFYERHVLGQQVALGASSAVLLVMGTRAIYRMNRRTIAVTPWALTAFSSVAMVHHYRALRELKQLNSEAMQEALLGTPAQTHV